MHYQRLSRRSFLKAGALTTMGIAVGCTAPTPANIQAPAATQQTTTTPTSTALPTGTPAPTVVPMETATALSTTTRQPTRAATQQPTSTPAADASTPVADAPTPVADAPTPTTLAVHPARADLISHYPRTAQSVVALVQHDGVWSGDRIEQHVVLQMLDAALTQLTGLDDAETAWRVLFDPGETIGIKVNTISRYTTTPEVAYAVAQRLQDAGIPAEQIVIFDRTDRELRDRGFTMNPDGPGVRCRGAKAWEESVQIAGSTQRIHDVMLSCDALINIPTLKEHGTSGFTSAMKNHYGTISDPGRLHGNHCDPYIAELNALPVIRNKTRLIVGDFVRICPYDWNRMTAENKLAMSFDPVAHDIIARQVLLDRREADGRPGAYIEGKSHYLDTAIELGLGAAVNQVALRKSMLG